MDLRIQPVTLANRAAIAEVIIRTNFEDPHGQTVWPNSTLESRIAGACTRLPQTLLADGVRLIKLLDGDQIIAYARWTLRLPVWRRLREQDPLPVTEEQTRQFERQKEESLDAVTGWPRGMRDDVVSACTPAMDDARLRKFPQEEDCIMLDQVKTLPAQQRRGAGSRLLKWDVDLADREGLKICLEATSFGLRLYEKFGYQKVAVVEHDVSEFGRPQSYVHTLMIRLPKVIV